MKKAIILITSLSALATLALMQETQVVQFGTVPVDTCLAGCHTDSEKFEKIAEDFQTGVHAKRGITCYDCHRPSAAHIEEAEPSTEFDRPPYPWEQPERCGFCHSDAFVMKRYNAAPDITAEQIFWTSHHGEALQKIRSQAATIGIEKAAEIASDVATCTECHGAHGIIEPSSPRSRVFPQNVAATCGDCHSDRERMTRFVTAMAQIDPGEAKTEREIEALSEAVHDYESDTNVHRMALEEKGLLDAPTCNDCHGNHGATPPGAFGATRVAEVCGTCHGQNYTAYENSVKSVIFNNDVDRDCYACHSNHNIFKTRDDMVGLQEGSICFECHQDPDLGGNDVISSIRSEIDRLKAARDEAEQVLDTAELKGMEVGEGRSKLVELNTALITARGKLHTFEVDPIMEATLPGYTLAEEARKVGEDALDQLAFRQMGLGASSLIIIFVAVLLFLKIRDIDKRKKEDTAGH